MLSSIRSVAVSIVSVMAFTFSALAAEGFGSTVSSGVSLPVFMSTQMVEPSVFTANASITDWDYSIPYVVRENFRDKLYAVRITPCENVPNQRFRNGYYCFARKDAPVGKAVFDRIYIPNFINNNSLYILSAALYLKNTKIFSQAKDILTIISDLLNKGLVKKIDDIQLCKAGDEIINELEKFKCSIYLRNMKIELLR